MEKWLCYCEYISFHYQLLNKSFFQLVDLESLNGVRVYWDCIETFHIIHTRDEVVCGICGSRSNAALMIGHNDITQRPLECPAKASSQYFGSSVSTLFAKIYQFLGYCYPGSIVTYHHICFNNLPLINLIVNNLPCSSDLLPIIILFCR